MRYKYFVLFILLFSYLYSLLDLTIMWYQHALFQSLSFGSYQFKLMNNFLLYYYILSFIIYLFLVSLLPLLTKRKEDCLLAIALLFTIHFFEDCFYWLNGLFFGIYSFQTIGWNPNTLLPKNYQWLQLSLGKIYLFDMVMIFFCVSLWYYSK